MGTWKDRREGQGTKSSHKQKHQQHNFLRSLSVQQVYKDRAVPGEMERSCQTLLEDRRFEAEDSTSTRDLCKNFFLPLTRQQRNLLHQDRLGALQLSTSFALPLLMNSVTSLEINGGSANPARSSCRRPARRPRHLLSLTQTDGEQLPDSSANGHPVRAPHPHPARAGHGNKSFVEVPAFSPAIPVQKRGAAVVLLGTGLGEGPSISLHLRMLSSVLLSQTATEVSRTLASQA